MKTSLDCVPCFVRQTLEAARMASTDIVLHDNIMREVLGLISKASFDNPPPLLASSIHRRLRELTGTNDIYAAVKKRSTEMALQLLPEIEASLQKSRDQFDTAVRVAIAGNVIDFGVNSTVHDAEVRAALLQALDAPICGDLAEFVRATYRARSILYLADNAGEIVFDQLLIRLLGSARVIVALRGAPILNDATISDAQNIGLDSKVRLIDNGADIPGTVLKYCSEAFKQYFAAADLIIAKGQGNYETLSETHANIFFLFKVKCGVVADQTRFPVGTNLVLKAQNSKT